MPFSTTKQLMPSLPAPSVRAKTTCTPACAPLVIHIFEPSRTHPSPSGRAVVRNAAASEPQPGSLSAKLAGPSFPSAYGRSHFSFCSGEACSDRIFEVRLLDASTTAVDAHAAAMASMASA